MYKVAKVFFAGLLVSFVGTLPLGVLNIAAMQIAISSGVYDAMMFAIGALTAEVVYVRLSLVAMDWLQRKKNIFYYFEWATIIIIFALAISNFYVAWHPSHQKNIILSAGIPKFLLGLLMSAINPVQIPFWFGWSAVLFSKQILIPQKIFYNFYIVGIGIGTFFGNCVFIFGGKLVADKLNNSQQYISLSIGIIFLITALLQLIKILRKKDSSHKI